MKKVMVGVGLIILSFFLVLGESQAARKPSVTLKRATTEVTAEAVAVNVKIKKKGGKVKSIKWRSGMLRKTGKKYWKNAYSITASRRFYANDNGWYTVRVQNKKNKTVCQSIYIKNIDKEGPVIQSEYSVTNRVAVVRVTATDVMSEVAYVGYAQGYVNDAEPSLFTPAQASTGSSVFADSSSGVYQFKAAEPGYYTIYARDEVGNESLEYVQVTLWKDLYDMAIFDLEESRHEIDTMYDRWGKAYTNPISLRVLDDSGAYLEYHLEGNYTQLTGTIVREKGIDDDSIVWLEFYADGEKVYTLPKMDYKTQAKNFEISLKRARYLKIKCCCISRGNAGNVLITDARLYK